MGLNQWPLWQRTVSVWGRKMHACSLDRLAYLLLHKVGVMGRAEAAFFASAVKPGMTVVEAGSNLGLYTLLFSKLVGETGQVHAFEPDPVLVQTLRENVRANGATNVQVHACAVGAVSESRTLRRGGMNSGDNRLAAHADAATEAGPETAEVQVVALDEALAGTRVDFIKVDVQGWEAELFKGLRHLPKANPQVRVFFEYWPHGLRGAGCDPQAWLRSLVETGWHLYSSVDGRPFQVEEAAVLDHGGKRFINLLATRQ